MSIDRSNRILVANSRLEEMLGFPASDLCGRYLPDLVAGGCRASVLEHLQDRDPRNSRLRAELLRANGTSVPVLFAATEFGTDHTDIRILTRIDDLPETLQVQRELDRSEQRLRALVEALPDMVFRFDVHGDYLEVLVADDEVLALPRNQITGRTLEEVIANAFPLEVGNKIRSTIQAVIADLRPRAVDYELAFGGELRQFEARIAPIDANEVIAIVRDTSALHRAEQERIEHERQKEAHRAEMALSSLERELERASKIESIGYLAATVAHDVNNLLGVIANHAAVIAAAGMSVEAEREAEVIATAVELGADLVGRLLEMGHRPSESHRLVSLRDVIEEVADVLQAAFPRELHQAPGLVIELGDERFEVRGSTARIEQAVMNLVLNARDATLAAGPHPVTLGVDARRVRGSDLRPSGLPDGDYVVVRVTDSAGGIPLSIRGRVFDPFVSLKDGLNLGLGLPIVRSVAEEHGGAVEIHDITTDGLPGTRMELWLPALREITRSDQTSQVAPTCSRSVEEADT